MIRLSQPLDGSELDALEAYFFEEGLSNWAIIQEVDGGAYRLEGFFEERAAALAGWTLLLAEFPDFSSSPIESVVHDSDWKEKYKSYLRPWVYGQLHWVPEWMRGGYVVPENSVALYLDAGMAFGTGMHETTQLCGQCLVDYVQTHAGNLADKKILDLGCGSGILALSAKKLGLRDILGVDIDPDAVEVSIENAQDNGLAGEVDFALGGFEILAQKGPYDLVLANILAPVLMEHAGELLSGLRSGSRLVLSGILGSELAEVRAVFESKSSSLGLSLDCQEARLGDWSMLSLQSR